MPRLGALVADRATVLVPFGGSGLTVTYRPNVVTPRMQRLLAQAQRDGDLDAGFLDPLIALVASWDLTDDDERTIPIDRDALSSVPVAILLAVLTAIAEDMAPNRASAGGSSSSSSPMAVSAPALNGTSS